jgi:hypothetical protein
MIHAANAGDGIADACGNTRPENRRKNDAGIIGYVKLALNDMNPAFPAGRHA